MANITIKHSPNLTKESLKALFTAHFSNKGYEIGFSSLIGADIYIKKNAWVGAAIKIKQKSNATVVRVNGFAPSIAVRLLLYGLITILILLPKWNKLVKEVKDFITSEEFNQKTIG